MSDSSKISIVIIHGTVGLYTVATRCHRCFAVTLKYTEDSSLKILPHSLATICMGPSNGMGKPVHVHLTEFYNRGVRQTPGLTCWPTVGWDTSCTTTLVIGTC